MTAASDIVERLRARLHDYPGHITVDRDLVDEVRAAIAKATGAKP